MIRVEGLAKSFGPTAAVQEVSLQVKKQDIFGLVGPDGAGKTTLMRMICGLITPDRGRVYLMGEDSNGSARAKENLGYMPQRFSLYGDLTVWENIKFFGSMYRLGKTTIRQRADEILALTNLAAFEDRLADNLSGGMKQKLALTCSLITRPRILVLDEPTYGVDPESRKEFWKILYRLNREGMTILVSTPYMDEAELCNMVAFINQGRIVALDSPVNHKKNFPHRLLEVRAPLKDPDTFAGFPRVMDSSFFGDKFHLVVEDADTVKGDIARYLAGMNLGGYSIDEVLPTMEDVFVSLAEKEVG